MKNKTDGRQLPDLGDRIKSLQTDQQTVFDREHPANQAHIAWRMVFYWVPGVGGGPAGGLVLITSLEPCQSSWLSSQFWVWPPA